MNPFYLCLFVRFLIILLIPKFKTYLKFIFTIIAIGFITIYLFNLRKTGLETGGKPIWWDHLRPIHGILYLGSAIYLFKNNTLMAQLLLTIDLIIGFNAWITNIYL